MPSDARTGAAVTALFLGIFAAASVAAQTVSARLETFDGLGGTRIEGTLLMPADAAGRKVPAVLIVQGSGPTDRDGNQPPNLRGDLMKQFAEALAARGIASLRYDKRGMYANARHVPRDADPAIFFGWENFIGDVAAAYRHLAGLSDINGARVAILGHSEGGTLALAAAKAAGATAPAALVLAATPGRPYDVLLIEQVDALMRRQGASDAVREALNQEHRRIVEHIRANGTVPGDMHPGLAALYPAYIAPFFQAAFKTDPGALAGDYAGPVLILQGDRDIQVSAERDAKRLDEALAKRGRGEHRTAIFAGLNHSFRPVADPTQPKYDGLLPAEVSSALTDWLVPRLAEKR